MTVAPTPHLRRSGLVLSIASLGVISVATLLPARPIAVSSHFCIVCGSLGGINAALNVLLFLPLGIGLALAGLPAKRALLAMAALSALIELAQLSVISGRHATIGDVLFNSLGGALGFMIGRYATDWLRPRLPVAWNLAAGWATVWIGLLMISNFGFAVSLPDSQYYGQIARALPPFEVFPGQVLSASIDDVDITDTALADSRRVERLLAEGATVSATVVPVGTTQRIASVVRVADADKKEIALLAQDGERLVFGVQTGAVALRLRPPLFSLTGAFPSPIPGIEVAADTLRLSGRYSASDVRMIAQRASANHNRRIPVSASLGWIFWLPFQWLVEGTRAEFVVSWIWLACLTLPLGYWFWCIEESSRSQSMVRRWAPVVLFGILLFCVGLVLVPRAFGLPIAPFREWLATLGGVLTGVGLAALTGVKGDRPRATGG